MDKSTLSKYGWVVMPKTFTKVVPGNIVPVSIEEM